MGYHFPGQEERTSPVDKGTMERGSLGRDTSDNEDSEVDDYNLTEDQRRALEELDNLKTEMGYPGRCHIHGLAYLAS